MTAWDMARLSSKRPLRKPIKMHGPVGESADWSHGNFGCLTDLAHECCGMHVCSCEMVAAESLISSHASEHTRDPDVSCDTVDRQGPESHSQAVVEVDRSQPQQKDGVSHIQLMFEGRPLELGDRLSHKDFPGSATVKGFCCLTEPSGFFVLKWDNREELGSWPKWLLHRLTRA